MSFSAVVRGVPHGDQQRAGCMEQLAGHQDDLSGQLPRRPRGRRWYTRARCKVAFLRPWLAVPVLLVCLLFSVAVITGCGEEQNGCLLYTSDAADDLLCVDLGGRRIIKKKNK